MSGYILTIPPFSKKDISLIEEATNFLVYNINEHYGNDVIEEKLIEKKETINEINKTIKFIKNKKNQNRKLNTRIDKMGMIYYYGDILCSILQYYFSYIEHQYKITNNKNLKNKLNHIDKIMDLWYVDGEISFFSGDCNTYDEFKIKNKAQKEGLIFISYSTSDKKVAGYLFEKLSYKYDIFLAHEKIKVSKDWRAEILKHLEICNYCIAIITDDFIESPWCNQEIGYILARNVPIIPLFLSKNKKSGFIESKQGIIVNDIININLLIEKLSML